MKLLFSILLLLTISNSVYATCYPHGTELYRPFVNNNSKIIDIDSRVKYAKGLLAASKRWSQNIRKRPAKHTYNMTLTYAKQHSRATSNQCHQVY